MSEKKWYEKDGVTYIPVPVMFKNKTGKEWKNLFKEKGIQIEEDAEMVFSSKDFKPKKGNYVIAIIKGDIFPDEKRNTKNVRAEAERLNFSDSVHGDICYIRYVFTYGEIKEMGLTWIIGMHKPVKVPNDKKIVVDEPMLMTEIDGSIDTAHGKNGNKDGFEWAPGCGFVFNCLT